MRRSLRRFLLFILSIMLLVLGFPLACCSCKFFSTHIDVDSTLEKSLKNKGIAEVRFRSSIWSLFVPKNADFLAIGNTIYVDWQTWETEKNNESYLQPHITHESIHASRQASTGLFIWLAWYFLSPSFRWQEEKLAYTAQWRSEIDYGLEFDEINFESFALIASGPAYHNMVSQNEAYKFIKETVSAYVKKKTEEKNKSEREMKEK